jgi:hypothetical protein
MSKSEAVARAEIDASIHQADTGMASTVPRATGGEVQALDSGPHAAAANSHAQRAAKMRYSMRRFNPNVCRPAPARTEDRR